MWATDHPIIVVINADVVTDVPIEPGLLAHLIGPELKAGNVIVGRKGVTLYSVNDERHHIPVLQLRRDGLALDGRCAKRCERRIPVVLQRWLILPLKTHGRRSIGI